MSYFLSQLLKNGTNYRNKCMVKCRLQPDYYWLYCWFRGPNDFFCINYAVYFERILLKLKLKLVHTLSNWLNGYQRNNKTVMHSRSVVFCYQNNWKRDKNTKNIITVFSEFEIGVIEHCFLAVCLWFCLKHLFLKHSKFQRTRHKSRQQWQTMVWYPPITVQNVRCQQLYVFPDTVFLIENIMLFLFTFISLM